MHNPSELEISSDREPEVQVICIGNSVAGDDAIGCEIYARLIEEYLPSNVQMTMLGLGGIALLEHLRGQRLLLIVDAVQLGGDPGDIHIREIDEILPAETPAVSLHGISLRDTFDIAEALYSENVPQRTLLIGIEGRNFNELGIPPSSAVEAAKEKAVTVIKRLIANMDFRNRCLLDYV